MISDSRFWVVGNVRLGRNNGLEIKDSRAANEQVTYYTSPNKVRIIWMEGLWSDLPMEQS